MLEAVVLGVSGVLVSTYELQLARIDAAACGVMALGGPAVAFQEAAQRRLRDEGPTALISRTVAELQLKLDRLDARRLEMLAREATPRPRRLEPLRAALSRLAGRYRVAFLDDGEPRLLDDWLQAWGLADRSHYCLWCGNLGRQARFPSPYAFRWLSERMQLRDTECLYVAGSDVSRRGAERARWQTLTEPRVADDSVVDLDVLADRLGA